MIKSKMDGQKLQSDEKKPNKFYYLKRTLQFAISLSLLSALFYYYSRFSLFPNSFFNVYFLSFLFSFFRQTLERRYVFLLCNGILAFLARSSVSSTSLFPSGSDLDEVKAIAMDHDAVPEGSSTDKRSLDNIGFRAVHELHEPYKEWQEDQELEDEREDKNGWLSKEEDKEEQERKSTVSLEEDSEEKLEEINGVWMQQGGEGEEEDNDDNDDEEKEKVMATATTASTNEGVASTEELNKKFEEFIRKMKEEIRIDAQQQLIAV